MRFCTYIDGGLTIAVSDDAVADSDYDALAGIEEIKGLHVLHM